MTKRAVIYVRASLDATGQRQSIGRQEAACRALAEARGWAVAEVVSDNSISAYGDKHRPGWRTVLGMIERQEVDVVVAWHLDRLTRSMLDLETLILLADKSGVGVATATGDIDLTTDAGRMVARILAAVARAEVERKAARQKLANATRARQGVPHSGGVRTFGYAANGLDVVDEEADAIREAASLVLGGEPLQRVAKEWERRGLVSSRAGKARGGWTARGVAYVLGNPRYAGRRIYNGEDVGEGAWEPILDLETHLALRALLDAPERRRGAHKNGRAPGSLLSGLARCAECGGPVRASSSRGRLDYKCQGRYCAQVPREVADEWVAAHVLAIVARPGVLAELAPSGDADVDKAKVELETARERLDGLAGAYAVGAIDLGQLQTATATLRATVERSEAILASSGKGRVLGSLLDAEDVAEAWEAMPLSQARAVVEALLEVKIRPHPRPSSRPVLWDPEEVLDVVEIEHKAA